jgi:thiol peroxidase
MSTSTPTVTFKGTPLHLLGAGVSVGDTAPDFTVLANDLAPVTATVLRGNVTVLLSVPSLDTPVCDLETKRFNKEAAALGPKVRILCVSADLPFAQARWCGAAGVKAVTTLSDHRDTSFGLAFGVLIKELRLLTRAVFVVGPDAILRYAEIVPELTNEPDYAAALAVVRNLV